MELKPERYTTNSSNSNAERIYSDAITTQRNGIQQNGERELQRSETIHEQGTRSNNTTPPLMFMFADRFQQDVNDTTQLHHVPPLISSCLLVGRMS